eukprot:4735760-Pyramimonas_sp.AAC.1
MAAHVGTPQHTLRGPAGTLHRVPPSGRDRMRPRAHRMPISGRRPRASWPFMILGFRANPFSTSISARPSGASWPDGELHPRPQWHRPRASPTPIPAHPSHAS